MLKEDERPPEYRLLSDVLSELADPVRPVRRVPVRGNHFRESSSSTTPGLTSSTPATASSGHRASSSTPASAGRRIQTSSSPVESITEVPSLFTPDKIHLLEDAAVFFAKLTADLKNVFDTVKT